jgi:hypothetical protein
MLLLVGQAVPFLGHLEECGALLSGCEVSSQEMELTCKPPILFRFARHSGPLGKQRGERKPLSREPPQPQASDGVPPSRVHFLDDQDLWLDSWIRVPFPEFWCELGRQKATAAAESHFPPAPLGGVHRIQLVERQSKK